MVEHTRIAQHYDPRHQPRLAIDQLGERFGNPHISSSRPTSPRETMMNDGHSANGRKPPQGKPHQDSRKNPAPYSKNKEPHSKPAPYYGQEPEKPRPYYGQESGVDDDQQGAGGPIRAASKPATSGGGHLAGPYNKPARCVGDPDFAAPSAPLQTGVGDSDEWLTQQQQKTGSKMWTIWVKPVVAHSFKTLIQPEKREKYTLFCCRKRIAAGRLFK
jgi:hypothetical protein